MWETQVRTAIVEKFRPQIPTEVGIGYYRDPKLRMSATVGVFAHRQPLA